MVLSTKLLYLMGILVIASCKIEVVNASDDEESSIKQALFLVELLKSDFAKVLREDAHVKSGQLDANTAEDTNATCALRTGDYNSTTPFDEAEHSVSGASAAYEATTPMPPLYPLTSGPPNPKPPYSNWAVPMPGFIPPGQGQQGQLPDENYRLPYRYNRRRMMPDYYYFDAPMKVRGNFRRVNSNNPPVETSNDKATSQAETTTSLASTSEATTARVEENMTTTTRLSTMTVRPSTSKLFITESTSSTTTEPTTVSTTKLSSSSLSGPATSLTTESKKSSNTDPLTITNQPLSSLSTTIESIIPPTNSTTETASKRSKLRHGVGMGNHLPISKASGARTKCKHKRKHDQDAGLETNEDLEITQVKSELIKEFNGTEPENMTTILDCDKKSYKQPSNKKHKSTTMKIFLKGSSRLPVPLPENNAFCYSYPQNALCGNLM